MKKILSLVFAFMLIFSCFAVTAFAEDVYNPVITFSEDYQKLYENGEPYSRIDASMLDLGFYSNLNYFIEDEQLFQEKNNSYIDRSGYVRLSDSQREAVKDVDIQQNRHGNIYYVELSFNDGSALTVTFLRDTYLEEYYTIISSDDKATEYKVDFVYPDGNVVKTKKSLLFGETVKLTEMDFETYYYDVQYVYAQNSDGSLVVLKGELISIDDKYFYVDYAESNLDESVYRYEGNGEFTKCIFHEITDEQLISDFQNAERDYYDDDFGFLYDDEATDAVSAVFLILVFGIVPAVIFVILLIKAIRSKGVYKKLYGAVAAVSAAELTVFTIITVIIVHLN